MKRLPLIDIILTGIMAFAMCFLTFWALDGTFGMNKQFWFTLAVSVFVWNGFINTHPNNPNSK